MCSERQVQTRCNTLNIWYFVVYCRVFFCLSSYIQVREIHELSPSNRFVQSISIPDWPYNLIGLPLYDHHLSCSISLTLTMFSKRFPNCLQNVKVNTAILLIVSLSCSKILAMLLQYQSNVCRIKHFRSGGRRHALNYLSILENKTAVGYD